MRCCRDWFNNYIDSLPVDDQNSVKMVSANNRFRFGDQNTVVSLQTATIPVTLGPKKVKLNTDIVDRDLPLLISRESMKKAGMAIDFATDTANVFGARIPLKVTRSGHYTVPLTAGTQALTAMETGLSPKIVLTATNHSPKRAHAWKIHRQFAHASTPKLLRLVNSAGEQWANDEELKRELQAI